MARYSTQVLNAPLNPKPYLIFHSDSSYSDNTFGTKWRYLSKVFILLAQHKVACNRLRWTWTDQRPFLPISNVIHQYNSDMLFEKRSTFLQTHDHSYNVIVGFLKWIHVSLSFLIYLQWLWSIFCSLVIEGHPLDSYGSSYSISVRL